jgi:molybdopterin molybdotransferase
MSDFESLTPDWLALDEAVARVMGAAHPLPPVTLGLDAALGMVTAKPVRALLTMPPFDNSAMDGYAVRASDIAGATAEAPVALTVVRAVHAGGEPGAPLAAAGQAVKIMTGAPVPPGADSVVRVEDTDGEAGTPGRVLIRSQHDRHRNIRPGGEDFRTGDEVVPAGVRVNAGWTALLVAAGTATVSVHRRPRVAILSCGDELRLPGDLGDVRAGRAVPESNGPMIAAALRSAGGEVVSLGIARDDPDDLRRCVEGARDADLLVTLGGASMGEADLLKRTLLDDGLDLDFWRVRMRPGSPVSFGHLPRRDAPGLPVLGLPGNPASAFVTYQVFGHPFVRRLSGDSRPHRSVVRAAVDAELRGPPRLCQLVRVVLETATDRRIARPAGRQGSGLVSSLGPATGLAVVPEGTEVVTPGDVLDVIRLDDGLDGSSEPGYRTRA